jgi:hypothetical protein
VVRRVPELFRSASTAPHQPAAARLGHPRAGRRLSVAPARARRQRPPAARGRPRRDPLQRGHGRGRVHRPGATIGACGGARPRRPGAPPARPDADTPRAAAHPAPRHAGAHAPDARYALARRRSRWRRPARDGRVLRRRQPPRRTVHEGPSRGLARIAGRDLEASQRGRGRVTVSDGFDARSARSSRFRADGRSPLVRITRPLSGEALRAAEPALLVGSAFDDRRRPLSRLSWFADRRQLGTGRRLRAKLPAGRSSLRLVARDARGRTGSARLRIAIAPRALRVEKLDGPFSVGRGARRATITIGASIPALLRIAGRRHHLARRTRRLRVRLPARPTAGLLRVAYTWSPERAASTATSRWSARKSPSPLTGNGETSALSSRETVLTASRPPQEIYCTSNTFVLPEVAQRRARK